MNNYEHKKEELFDIPQMFNIVSDLFVVKPYIYWLDMLISAAIGWGFFILSYTYPFFSIHYWATATISALALYRVWVFTHEISHFRRTVIDRDLKWFNFVWHIVAGVPLLSPGFLYHDVHREHHNAHKYAKNNDAEYLPFGAGSPLNMLFYPLIVWPMPLMAIFRITILSLLSLFGEKIRKKIREDYSSAGMVPSHHRELPKGNAITEWNIQETVCSIVWWTVIILTITGTLPPSLLIHWYIVMMIFMTVNFVRALTAHRYTNGGGDVTFHEQILDSVNVTGSPWLTEIWAPVGTRYHGLHHLFPTIPYHALGEAHNRLMNQLLLDHPYRKTVSPSLMEALGSLWYSAREWKRQQDQKKVFA